MGEECSNPGFENKYTCPACYHDFNDRRTTKCPACGAAVMCRLEQQPVCICELGTAEDEDEGDGPFTTDEVE